MSVDPALLEAAAKLAQSAEPVAVSSGWSWTSAGVWVLVAIMTPLVVAITRMWPAMRKLRNEADGSLRKDLMDRLKAVEDGQLAERLECERRLQAMQNKQDAIMRQFVQFQLTVVRYMPEEFAPHAQRAAANLMAIIARDVDEFAPDAEPERETPTDG